MENNEANDLEQPIDLVPLELPQELPDIQVSISENEENSNFTLENANFDQLLREAIFTIQDYFNKTQKPLKLVKKFIDKPSDDVSLLISSIDFENLRGTCVRESDQKVGDVFLTIMDLAKFSTEIKANLMKSRGTFTPPNKAVLDKSLEVFEKKVVVPSLSGNKTRYKKDVLKEFIINNPEGTYKDAEEDLSKQFGGEKIIQFSSYMYEARKNLSKEGKNLILNTSDANNKNYKLEENFKPLS